MLTATKIKNTRPKDRAFKLYDSKGVCGEFALKPRQAIGTGLGSDFASGKNLDLQP